VLNAEIIRKNPNLYGTDLPFQSRAV